MLDFGLKMSYHVLYIMKKDTIQNKSQLAKLLATVNIEVQETKQKQQYMGKYKRPDISGRKFEPTFIFKK